MEFFQDLFSSAGFIPRAICGNWTPGLIRLHNVSDFLIWTAYLAIPIVLIKFAYSKRRELPFRQLFWLFGIFILACGTTHLMDIVMFYNPLYRLSGLIKLVTAAASWGTVMALFHVVPTALKMRSPDELEREIAQRQSAETLLQGAHDELEFRVAQRTAELEKSSVELRASEDRFRLLIEAMPQIVWTARPDGFLDYYNQRWIDYTGMSVEQTRGFGWQPVVHPDDLQRCLDVWAHSVQSGENYEIEYRFKRASDGAYRWHLGRALPLRDQAGNIVKWFGTGTDIHDQKEAQQALQRSHHEQEQLVGERTRELQHANAAQGRLMVELERSNGELQSFASVASHDLQEPLRAVQAFGDRLKTRHGAALPPEAQDYLERMNLAAVRMRSLINDLLAYSRVTTKARPFVGVDLSVVVQGVVADLEARLEETGGRIEWDAASLPIIEADATQMHQLLQNLIGNGLKFHREDAPPVVRLGSRLLSAQAEDVPPDLRDATTQFCQILVEDEGIGFEAKFAERVFAPFERLHSQRKYEGTGIGLAICRKIVERHGGAITAKSALGQGTTFSIVLPVRQKVEDSL